tara:strand:+ start:171 stop:677 length:507 start_codon:yes stop_codon:yes gene_type:complete
MKNINSEIKKKAKRIKLLALDVDGILTDGGIYISDKGIESKKFFAQDGHGIKMIQSIGLEVTIISGRESKSVYHRAKELGIKKIIQNSKNKLRDFINLFSKQYNKKEICFMGDDIVDVDLMKYAGLAITVPNANSNNVIKSADWITPRSGGSGAVRDVCDLIYNVQKL